MRKYSPLLSLWIKALLLVTILSPVVLAAGKEEVPWDRLRDLAGRYLAACSSPKTVKALNRKLKQRVAQRVADSNVLDEDSALRSLMLDWAADNESAITSKGAKAVTQACVYLVTFLDKGYTLPEQVRTRLNPDAVREIIEYMEGEIAAAKPRPPQPDVPAVVKTDVVTRK
ncbi:MAG: hypothetical protein ABSE73_02135 [Planctomycetota bacterium]